MKIVVYGPSRRTGVLRDGNVVDISLAYAKYLREREGVRHAIDLAAAVVPVDLARFIDGGARTLEAARKALDHLPAGIDAKTARGDAIVFGANEVKLHAPRPAGARIACAGGNFADHAQAMAERAAKRGEMRAMSGDARKSIRDTGIWGFWKLDRDCAGPDAEITYPARASRLDYEGEIALVIGKQGKDIQGAKVKDYVWGATLLADWSIRGPMEPGPYKFVMQKNFDGSCSLGPCIVTGDEIDPFNVDVEVTVNGQRRQNFNTRDMVFSFGEYLEFLSRDLTFYPGDMISSGTAAGTAADSSPLLADGTPSAEWFLKPGDTVELKSPVIGTLRSKIVAKKPG